MASPHVAGALRSDSIDTRNRGRPTTTGSEALAPQFLTSNSMGSVVGPDNSVMGFHGAGPVRRGLAIRAVMTRSASASSIRAGCTPSQ